MYIPLKLIIHVYPVLSNMTVVLTKKLDKFAEHVSTPKYL